MPNLIRYINQENPEKDYDEEIFQRVLKKTFAEEGEYEDRKGRIDQPTNMGIIQDTLDNFRKAHPDLALSYPTTIRDLTKEQAAQIYRKDYFEPYHIGKIKHKALQENLFDAFVNHSPEGPANWTQEAINSKTNIRVKQDGIFGSETLSALNYLDNENDVKNVNNSILDRRLEDLKKNQRDKGADFSNYTKGIPSRIDRFRIK